MTRRRWLGSGSVLGRHPGPCGSWGALIAIIVLVAVAESSTRPERSRRGDDADLSRGSRIRHPQGLEALFDAALRPAVQLRVVPRDAGQPGRLIARNQRLAPTRSRRRSRTSAWISRCRAQYPRVSVGHGERQPGLLLHVGSAGRLGPSWTRCGRRSCSCCPARSCRVGRGRLDRDQRRVATRQRRSTPAAWAPSLPVLDPRRLARDAPPAACSRASLSIFPSGGYVSSPPPTGTATWPTSSTMLPPGDDARRSRMWGSTSS